MVDIKDVLTNSELSERFNKLCSENNKIKRMSDDFPKSIKSIKDKIDNWFKPTRNQLLDLLNIKENKEYKFLYHDKNNG